MQYNPYIDKEDELQKAIAPVPAGPSPAEAIREALMKKYAAAQDSSGVEAAEDSSRTTDLISTLGQALSQAASANSVSRGGPAASAAPFEGMRSSAKDAIKRAVEARQGKISGALGDLSLQDQADQRAQQADDRTYNRGQDASKASIAADNQAYGRSQDVAKAVSDSEKLKLEKQRLGLDTAKTNAEIDRKAAATAARPKSEGEKSQDRTFAKNYVEWIGGGRDTAEKSLARLEGAKARLQSAINSNTTVSGNIQGRLPDIARSEEGRNIESIVKESALAAIKSIVGGGAVSDKDVENVLASWYDPTLNESENLAKLTANIEEMKNKKLAKDAQAQHFASSGSTLTGYEESLSPEAPVDPKRQRLEELRRKKAGL